MQAPVGKQARECTRGLAQIGLGMKILNHTFSLDEHHEQCAGSSQKRHYGYVPAGHRAQTHGRQRHNHVDERQRQKSGKIAQTFVDCPAVAARSPGLAESGCLAQTAVQIHAHSHNHTQIVHGKEREQPCEASELVR